jgi:CheY-like chemotaxis protein
MTALTTRQRAPLAPHQLGILIVDDDPVQLMDMAGALTDAGLIVFEAYNSEQAVDLLSTRTDVRVLISDVDMPGSELNGYQLAKLVAARWPEIRLLVLSGRNNPKGTDLPDGARFVSKPCALHALTGNIFDLLSEQGGGI